MHILEIFRFSLTIIIGLSGLMAVYYGIEKLSIYFLKKKYRKYKNTKFFKILDEVGSFVYGSSVTLITLCGIIFILFLFFEVIIIIGSYIINLFM